MTQTGRTWWGARFIAALETFTDPGRLARGRAYPRNGKILSYEIERGVVTAQVRGSISPYYQVYTAPTYTTTVAMTPIPEVQWRAVIDELSTRAGFVTRLLMNEMPESIDHAFTELGVQLLPHDKEDFTTDCTCPDWDNPCKHVAGVYFMLAARLDNDPFLLFELRGLPRDALRHQLQSSPLGAILAAELDEPSTEIQPDASFYTPLEEGPPVETSYRDFWQGPMHLPELPPATDPAVAGLSVRQGGDFPGFWHKDTSFIETMVELYERIRTKSRGV